MADPRRELTAAERHEIVAFFADPKNVERAVARLTASMHEAVVAGTQAIGERLEADVARFGFDGASAAAILDAYRNARDRLDHAPECTWPRLADRPTLEWLRRQGGGAIVRCPECRRSIDLGRDGAITAGQVAPRAGRPAGDHRVTVERIRSWLASWTGAPSPSQADLAEAHDTTDRDIRRACTRAGVRWSSLVAEAAQHRT